MWWNGSPLRHLPQDSLQSGPNLLLPHSVNSEGKTVDTLDRGHKNGTFFLYLYCFYSLWFLYRVRRNLYSMLICTLRCIYYILNYLWCNWSSHIPDHSHSYKFHKCDDMDLFQHTFHNVLYSLDQTCRLHILWISNNIMMFHWQTYQLCQYIHHLGHSSPFLMQRRLNSRLV